VTVPVITPLLKVLRITDIRRSARSFTVFTWRVAGE
jgi:hypothetical protein